MRKLILAVALTGLFAASDLSAQNPSVTTTGTVTLDIPTVLYLSIPNPDVTFGNPTAADFGNYFAGPSVTLDWGGNVTTNLQLDLNQLQTSGGVTKAVGDLEASLDGGSSWQALTSTATTFTSSAAGMNTGDVVDFQMMLNYADAPGQYTGTLTYTVIAQ